LGKGAVDFLLGFRALEIYEREDVKPSGESVERGVVEDVEETGESLLC